MSPDMSPLFKLAIASGKAETVRSHLERGANANARDQSGASALLIAASRGRKDICDILLQHGADPGATDSTGRTAAQLALEWGFQFPVDTPNSSEPNARTTLVAENGEPSSKIPCQFIVEPEAHSSRSQNLIEILSTEPDVAYHTEQVNASFKIIDNLHDGDLLGWEAEPEASVPLEDSVRAAAARAADRGGSEKLDRLVKWTFRATAA